MGAGSADPLHRHRRHRDQDDGRRPGRKTRDRTPARRHAAARHAAGRRSRRSSAWRTSRAPSTGSPSGFPASSAAASSETAANLHPAWIGVDLDRLLTRELGKPVRAANDADVQGLGAVKGDGVELVITLGTGFGSSLFVDGRLVPNMQLAHHAGWRAKTYEEELGEGRPEEGRQEEVEQAPPEGDRLALGALQLRPPLHRRRQRREDRVRPAAPRQDRLERRGPPRGHRPLAREGELLWRPLRPGTGRLRRARLLRRDRRPRLQEDLPLAPEHGEAREPVGPGDRGRQVRLERSSSCATARARASRSTAAASTRRRSGKLVGAAPVHRRRLRRPGHVHEAPRRRSARRSTRPTTSRSRRASSAAVVEQLGEVRLRRRRARRHREAVRPQPRDRARAQRDAPLGVPRRRRSSASTTTSARRRSRTSSSSASPTRSSSRSGTGTTSTASRSRWPRSSASRGAASSTTRPARSATSSRTTCSRSSATSRWSRPISVDADRIRDEQVKVFRAIRPLKPEDVVRGQFDGYRKEPGVKPGLDRRDLRRRAPRDRLVALGRRAVLHPRGQAPAADGDRGHRRPEAAAAVAPLAPRRATTSASASGPKISISIGARVKKPGTEMRVDADRARWPSRTPAATRSSAYERLLTDAMKGDPTLFVREDAVEAAWTGRRRDPRRRHSRPSVRARDLGPGRGRPPDDGPRGLARPGRGAREAEARRDRRGAPPRRQRPPRRALEPLGAVPLRARLGHGARGLQRRTATAWDYFPHDHARSRAYRWNEDGLGGISDRHQLLCFALALWNGKDPILKERPFGLTNAEGNHGEDVKEYWFYLDATPTHSYLKYLYKYPAGRVSRTASSSRRTGGATIDEPEYELLDTGHLRRRAATSTSSSSTRRPSPEDILIEITVVQPRARGGDARSAADRLVPQHVVLEAASAAARASAAERPDGRTRHRARGGRTSGGGYLHVAAGRRAALHRERDERRARSSASPNASPYVKDAFHEYVVDGRRDAVNPARRGHEGGRAVPRSTIPAGGQRPRAPAPDRRRRWHAGDPLGDDFDRTLAAPQGRGRRVLRRGRSPSALSADEQQRHAAGVRRDALVEAVLQVRRAPLARRRPRSSRRPRPSAADGPQRRLAARLQRRRPLDAGHLGVPVVRGLGPRVPLRRARRSSTRSSPRTSSS